ncbi:MAG: hypothetical protein U5N58_07160 [Actinomycetota bacterium]|nr:hypothetical protein [Actinomycetota bacterium]
MNSSRIRSKFTLNEFNGNYNYVADWTTENFFLNFILMMQSSGVEEYEWVDGDLKFNFDAPETAYDRRIYRDLC